MLPASTPTRSPASPIFWSTAIRKMRPRARRSTAICSGPSPTGRSDAEALGYAPLPKAVCRPEPPGAAWLSPLRASPCWRRSSVSITSGNARTRPARRGHAGDRAFRLATGLFAARRAGYRRAARAATRARLLARLPQVRRALPGQSHLESGGGDFRGLAVHLRHAGLLAGGLDSSRCRSGWGRPCFWLNSPLAGCATRSPSWSSSWPRCPASCTGSGACSSWCRLSARWRIGYSSTGAGYRWLCRVPWFRAPRRGWGCWRPG